MPHTCSARASRPALRLPATLPSPQHRCHNTLRSPNLASVAAIFTSIQARAQARDRTRARALPFAKAHAPEVLLYSAARLIGLCVLSVMAHRANITGLLGKWDGAWYLGIARHGYDTSFSYRADGSLINTNIVFFPLYPALIRAFSWLGYLPAALLISWLSGIVAAIAIRSVGERLYDRRTGILLATLWGILPTALVESMAYTESLLTALMALALLFLLRGQWVAAGIASLFAGLTHPTGLAVAAAIDVCALLAIIRRTDGWRPWLGAILAPLGTVTYLAWVGIELGQWDAWSVMQNRGWHNAPSVTGTWHEIVLILTKPQQLGYYVALGVVLLALISAAALTWGRNFNPAPNPGRHLNLDSNLSRDHAPAPDQYFALDSALLLDHAPGSALDQHLAPDPAPSLDQAPAPDHVRDRNLYLNRARLAVLILVWVSLAAALWSGPVYFHSKARFLLPVFPLLLSLAVPLARQRLRALATLLGSAALASAWYGGYLLTIWTRSP